MFAEIAFWACLVMVVYIYAGYPASVLILSLFNRHYIQKDDVERDVTIVISAFNEQRDIERTVVNKLLQDYPSDKLSVIVVSDASTDDTDEIVRRLAECSDGRVTLLRQDSRQGKTQALNRVLANAFTEIVVFADANSMYADNAIRSLVRAFADPRVGYVTGNMVYMNPTDSGIGDGSGRYMSYENLLRMFETRLGSIVGVDGGIDAIRRDLFVPMRPDQLPDFVLPLSVVEQGKRVVYEPAALVYEPSLPDANDEFRMRVRVALRAFWALFDKRKLLNPFRFGLFSWQLVSHKVFRYAAFVPLLGLALFNALLVTGHWFYAVFMLLQVAAYGFAALGHLLRTRRISPSFLLIPYYFVLLNAACVVAFWKFATRQRMVVWTPRVGSVERA